MTNRNVMQRVIIGGALAAALAGLPFAGSAEEGEDFVISGDPAKGAETYKLYCVTCHGETGAGDGIAATALDPKPKNFRDKESMAKLTDKEIFTAIKDGGPAVGLSPLMVAWGPLLQDDQKVHDVAAYVKTLASQE